MGGRNKSLNLRTLTIPEGTELGKAEKLRRTKDPQNFRQSVLSEGEFMGIKLPDREWILQGLMVEESMTIVNGYRGFGKTWFIQAMANAVTWGDKMGPWNCPKPRNAMIIDGEMPLGLLQERLRLLNLERDVKDKPAALFIYPEAYAYRIGLNRANILDTTWRARVKDAVSDLDVKLLVLDNLSSLAPGIDENDKTPFDPVNRWLLELRFNGVAIVMTHHTGKSGDQRGTSAHEDHVDTALMLNKPDGWDADMGCAFTCVATKDRAYLMQGASYDLKLKQKEGGRLYFWYNQEGESRTLVKSLIRSGEVKTAKEAYENYGISESTYYRAKKELRNE